MRSSSSHTVVDLFSGAGGLSFGFAQAGFTPVFAADFDDYACATYRRNIGQHVHALDLKALRASDIADLILKSCKNPTVVAGGPPCQGFSIQRRGAPADDRNDLVVKFAEIAVALRPRAIVMENVPTILGPRGRKYLTSAIRKWIDAGYSVRQTILEAAEYGVPQFRRRAFIVAVDKAAQTFEFLPPTHRRGSYTTVRSAIGDLPPPAESAPSHPVANHVIVKMSEINLRRIRHVPEGGGRLDIPVELQLPCHRKSNGHRHLDVYGRLTWDMPAPTITAMFDNFTRGRFAHPVEDRNITSREGARIQSFPDDYEFIGPKKDVARQIGNAVPPRLALAVAKSVHLALENQRREQVAFDQQVLPL